MEGTFVVIGGGIAGVSCAESLAFLAPEERVILITASPLIKAVTNIVPLSQMMTRFDVQERDALSLSEMHPSISIIHDTVMSVDLVNKYVETESGQIVRYKKLCLCNGASPKMIAQDNPHVLGIRDTESVNNFSKKVKNARRIVIVGNGGIATEIVHEIQGIEMIWVIKDKHISATFVDPGAAEFFQYKLLKKGNDTSEDGIVKRMKYKIADEQAVAGGAALGPDWHRNYNITGISQTSSPVQVEYSCELVAISSESHHDEDNTENWPIYVKLTNGKNIGCDFVVSATGVIPNSVMRGSEELKRGEDGGYLVDDRLKTSEKDVFAAGDVCTANWDLAQHWFQMRLWTQAMQMGRYAAKSMVCEFRGEECLQDFCFELFTHVTKFFGFKVVLLGLYNGQKLKGEYEILLRVTKGAEYVKLILKNGKLQGAVLIGETNLEEMCENLILDQLDLSVYGEDLLNPDIDVEDYFD
ncbi:pyridine nucleotide-disulfide oxidoreductase domain-containing protein 1 [Athalia rosae]|uniref:pyridine nucleotide-disulfide oxidoreductase domain-containing protein 1 n=1 Tax=Athalia rosae TaxID=37344 RepID=UPI0020343B0B|nr:pyridine nucleotide-disulfide oxidoreductase domain-containing protein 1 [Athalia rosae]